MRRMGWLALGIGSMSSAVACADAPSSSEQARVVRTSGSAVTLTRDERVAVAVNRTAGFVSVFRLKHGENLTQLATATPSVISTGPDSEPWTAIVGVDDDTAYVLLRKSQEVVRITGLHSQPVLDVEHRVRVGAEPMALALSPSGKLLFVANWADGSVSLLRTDTFKNYGPLDLNQALADKGVLGSLEARTALAHPRALAITDDGDADDDDETLYATEFFSQALPDSGLEPDLVDVGRQGLVYPISVGTGQVGAPISLAPVAQTGFVDGEGRMTGCFPNQLYAAAVSGQRLYVTSMCTSPRGPLGPTSSSGESTPQNFKTLLHPAVFVIDTQQNTEVPGEGRLLTQVLESYGDEPNRRMPLIPNDIQLAAPSADGSRSAFVSALGADAVSRLDYDASGGITIGAPGARYMDVGATRGLPTGVATSLRSQPPFVLAVSDAMQRLSVMDGHAYVAKEELAPDDPTAESIRNSDANRGHRLFATGLGQWSYKGEAWSSCESCHPGGLTDGVTWFFSRGPRRTLSAAGTYDKNPDLAARTRRLMLWGANIDEVHDVESIVRSVSGGAGGMVWTYSEAPLNDCRLSYDGNDGKPPPEPHANECEKPKPTSLLRNGLNGSLTEITIAQACASDAAECDSSARKDWSYIDAFIRGLRAPRAPSDLKADEVEEGRILFERACSGCHGGSHFTVSRQFYQPGEAWNGALPYTKPAEAPAANDAAWGRLRLESYQVDEELRVFNPAAMATGSALLRTPATTGQTPLDVAYNTAAQGNDQLRCALRAVGTFDDDELIGVAPPDVRVWELRQDMKSPAQGSLGCNVPSLFGVAAGAPYFHAGNARTLEELLSDEVFSRHARAIDPDLMSDPILAANQRRYLVAFLLSIDDDTVPVAVPSATLAGHPVSYDYCP